MKSFWQKSLSHYFKIDRCLALQFITQKFSEGDAVPVVLSPFYCIFKQEGRVVRWTDCPGINLTPNLTFLNSIFSTLLLFLLFSALKMFPFKWHLNVLFMYWSNNICRRMLLLSSSPVQLIIENVVRKSRTTWTLAAYLHSLEKGAVLSPLLKLSFW